MYIYTYDHCMGDKIVSQGAPEVEPETARVIPPPPGRERLTTTVTKETALLLVWHAKSRGLSQGELIDSLAQQHLPAVSVAGAGV